MCKTTDFKHVLNLIWPSNDYLLLWNSCFDLFGIIAQHINYVENLLHNISKCCSLCLSLMHKKVIIRESPKKINGYNLYILQIDLLTQETSMALFGEERDFDLTHLALYWLLLHPTSAKHGIFNTECQFNLWHWSLRPDTAPKISIFWSISNVFLFLVQTPSQHICFVVKVKK